MKMIQIVPFVTIAVQIWAANRAMKMIQIVPFVTIAVQIHGYQDEG
jgi:hypothetical protein